MALKAIPAKRKKNSSALSAYSFLSTIESTWKGHQKFACWLVKRMKPKIVVDLGIDRGLSMLSFACQNRGHVYGIDWFEDVNYATKCFALDSAFRSISNAIRFHYAKNIHLIVGPFQDIAKKWNKKIDILHMDFVHSYGTAKRRFEQWEQFLTPKSVVLIHDIVAFPEETGRFFEELAMHKFIFSHAQGLGVASLDPEIIEEIKKSTRVF